MTGAAANNIVGRPDDLWAGILRAAKNGAPAFSGFFYKEMETF
jgi:hypothetical protein